MADKWRRIADKLAARLANYEDCPQRGQHPAGAPDCPFCEDAAVYRGYVAAGGRDFRNPPGARPVTIAELAARPPDDSS